MANGHSNLCPSFPARRESVVEFFCRIPTGAAFTFLSTTRKSAQDSLFLQEKSTIFLICWVNLGHMVVPFPSVFLSHWGFGIHANCD